MNYRKSILFILLCIGFHGSILAQCAMCKAVAESDPGISGGLSDGILYLMAVPYVLMGVIGFFIYKHYTKNRSDAE